MPSRTRRRLDHVGEYFQLSRANREDGPIALRRAAAMALRRPREMESTNSTPPPQQVLASVIFEFDLFLFAQDGPDG